MYSKKAVFCVLDSASLAGLWASSIDYSQGCLEKWLETGEARMKHAFVNCNETVIEIEDEINHRVLLWTGKDEGQNELFKDE